MNDGRNTLAANMVYVPCRGLDRFLGSHGGRAGILRITGDSGRLETALAQFKRLRMEAWQCSQAGHECYLKKKTVGFQVSCKEGKLLPC